MPDSTKLKVDEKHALNNELTSFSDGYPILIINETSLHDLNSRSTETLLIVQFRPNLVIMLLKVMLHTKKTV